MSLVVPQAVVGGYPNAGALDGSAPSPFSPTDIAGLQMWLDASDAGTITESGGAVSQWDDKSDGAHHVSQGTASAQPTTGVTTLNGKNVIDFAGDWLQAALASDWTFLHDGTSHTIFAVMQMGVVSNPGAAYVLFGTNDGGDNTVGITVFYDDRPSSSANDQINQYITDGSGRAANRPVDHRSANGAWPANAAAIFRLEGDADNVTASERSKLYRNDGAAIANNNFTKAPPTVAPTHPLTIGANGAGGGPLTGFMAEVLVYNQALSAADKDTIEAYLADKWGITL